MLWFLVLEIIGCVLLIFWLWGQKCRSNLLQSLYSAIFVGPHFILIKALNKFGMGRLIPKYVDCVEAVLGNNSPFAQILYFCLMLGGYTSFILTGFPLLQNNHRIPAYHRWVSLGVVCFSLAQYVHLCNSDPGLIKDQQEAKRLYQKYPPDDVYYLKNTTCSTCRTIKPAMSKHCSSCGGCVARYDHHCIWLRKCVGEKNYLEFLAFLIVHLGLCWYGTYVISMILLGWADATRLWTARVTQNNITRRASYLDMMTYTLGAQPVLMTLLSLVSVLGVTLFFFLSFQLYAHYVKGSTSTAIFRPPRKVVDKLRRLSHESKHSTGSAKRGDNGKRGDTKSQGASGRRGSSGSWGGPGRLGDARRHGDTRTKGDSSESLGRNMSMDVIVDEDGSVVSHEEISKQGGGKHGGETTAASRKTRSGRKYSR